ncbi:MAG: cytochrome C oxidase subunit IV family protein [Candidatus Krumholzibacteria bacterium]
MTEHAKHRLSSKDYVMVFLGLMVLTGLTVALSYTGLGEGMRTFLAFAIASAKALLVALLFMHLRFEPRPIIIFAVTPVVLAVLFILAISPEVGVVR